nr:YbaB/EbfC family nucleoid-associated protein [Motilibacter deserti]
MQAVLQQAQQLQQQVLDAQAELAEAQVSGTAGGGLVTATVSGAGELLGLEISPDAVDPADTETLADLVVAAVRDATTRAAELQARAMGPMSEGLGAMGGAFGGLPGGGGIAGGRAGGTAGGAAAGSGLPSAPQPHVD